LPLSETSSDLAVYFSRTASSLGDAYVRSGRGAEGLALLDRAAGHAASLGFSYSQALVVGMLGEAQLVADDIDGAGRSVGSALELARRFGQRGWEARALRLDAELAAHQTAVDVAEAEARFVAAAALARELEMRPLLAHCRLGLGSAYARAGIDARARTEVEAALAE